MHRKCAPCCCTCELGDAGEQSRAASSFANEFSVLNGLPMVTSISVNIHDVQT